MPKNNKTEKPRSESSLRECNMAEALGFSALTKIVSTAVGLVCNKVYDGVTNQLKDGDVANESLHEIIVRDLNDIKSKLDCLSLKELDSSYSFLKEGVQWLNLAIGSASKDENDSPPGEASRILKDSASDILNEASSLHKAIGELNTSCKDRFLTAKDRFRASRERATDAFNNRSLNTKNRIMASKLRVAASILESGLEDPQAVVAACLVSLKELHDLSGIQDRFFVVLKGGLKSRLKTEERLENIMSVLSINHALFDFASKHSSEYPNAFTWPGIEIGGRKFSPMLHANEILERTSSREKFSLQLSRMAISERKLFFDFAINSRSEVVQTDVDAITVIKNTGKVVLIPVITKGYFVEGIAIAVDSNDNVYVVGRGEEWSGNNIKNNFVLYALDENYDLKHETTLDFLHAKDFKHPKIAVNKNENIVMIQEGDNHVYICNSKGQLKFQFERDSSKAFSLSTTHNNDIIIPSDDYRSIHVYTSEGNLKSTFKAPEGHEIEDVAFHYGISKVIVLTSVKEQRHKTLLCYSETGELKYSEVFNEQGLLLQMDIAGHCSGPFVVLRRDRISVMGFIEVMNIIANLL